MTGMQYLDLAESAGRERQRMLLRLHNSGVASDVEEVATEGLDGLVNREFGVGHSVVHRPRPVGGDGSLNPLGDVELDCPADVYTVVSFRREAGFDGDSGELQLLIVPDERCELIAYTRSRGVDSERRTVDLQFDHAPSQRASTAVPVESSKLVDPPQCTPEMAAGRVVGLRGFDEFAHPLGQSAGYPLVEGRLTGGHRVRQSAGVRWGIGGGVVDDEFIEQSVERGPQIVKPLSKQHGQGRREGVCAFDHDDLLIWASVDVFHHRVGLQMFGRDVPHLVSVRRRSLNSLKEDIEMFVLPHKT